MIIFARHGQTVYNIQGKFQGHCDSPLTDKGKSQAKKLGIYLSDKNIKKFILSPLPRTYQTYRIANENINVPYEIEEQVREICYGSWEGEEKSNLQNLKTWTARKKDRYNFIHPGYHKDFSGESYAGLYSRVKPYLEELFRNQESNESVCIISHLGVMRCIYKYFKKLDDYETGSLEIPNNKIYIVEGLNHYEKEL